MRTVQASSLRISCVTFTSSDCASVEAWPCRATIVADDGTVARCVVRCLRDHAGACMDREAGRERAGEQEWRVRGLSDQPCSPRANEHHRAQWRVPRARFSAHVRVQPHASAGCGHF